MKNNMKLAFSLLMCLASAALLPVQAATKATTYEQASLHVNDDGYILFVYGDGWDKRAKELTTALYENPAVVKAAGNAVMMLVPLTEGADEKQKAALAKIMGKLELPHVHSKHSFPAVVMYDKTGRIYSWISGPAMVHPEAERIALTISRRRAGLAKQQQILAAANEATGEDRAHLLLQACRIDNLERPDRVQQLIKEADPEDKSGCLAALNFHNNPLGDKVKDMKLADILVEMDKAIANPLHTVQQKQNACAFTIGTIRRRVGTGGSHLIRKYAEQMKALDPGSVLGQSADIVIRDWATGLQYVRGWSPQTLPMQGVPTELLGRLPISEAGTYEVRFTPAGGRNSARVVRVELLDGDKSISIDDRAFNLTSPASYFVTAPSRLQNPRILVTFDNDEESRDTRGSFSITKK